MAAHFLYHVHSAMETRIINGTKAGRSQYPFFVKLFISDTKNQTMSTCGGSLISENVILTAAHCLSHTKEIVVWAHCGYFNAKDTAGRQVHKSKQTIVHERYDSITLQNDIALVILETAAKITDTVDVIKFSCDYTPPKLAMTVIGNGLVNNSRIEPDDLYWASLITISNGQCADFYDDVSASMICAIGRNQATCNGDSGGPAIGLTKSGVRQIAVLSFGPAACDVRLPNGFTRVGYYSKWITEKTGNASLTCS